MTAFRAPDLDLEVALTGIGRRPRGVSLALTAPLMLGLVACFSLSHFGSSRGERVGRARQVEIVLDPQRWEAVPRSVSPPRAPEDPAGTGTVDPKLMTYRRLQAELPKATAFTPDLNADLAELMPQGPTRLDFPQGLPIAPGGNGMARAASAALGRPRALAVEVDELRLVQEAVPILRNMKRGLSGSVLVRLRINADGVPLSAKPLDGPEETWDQITEAVLAWRYHVPARLKARAPLDLEVRFQLSYL